GVHQADHTRERLLFRKLLILWHADSLRWGLFPAHLPTADQANRRGSEGSKWSDWRTGGYWRAWLATEIRPPSSIPVRTPIRPWCNSPCTTTVTEMAKSAGATV